MAIDNKELTKLVKLCRKLGINTFRTEEYEFTLDNIAPTVHRRRQRSKTILRDLGLMDESIPEDKSDIPSNTLTDEEMLFWSVIPDPTLKEDKQ